MPASPFRRRHHRLLGVPAALLAVLAAALAVPLALAAIQPEPVTALAAPGDFRLPFPSGTRLFTLQGQNQGSHLGQHGRYAYDFASGPFDSRHFTVTASRAGRVVRVVQSYAPSADCDLTTYSQSNYVLLDHGGNIGTWYSHLLQNSVMVRVGQQVAQGQPLALSDHSGYVCGVSHLHFTAVNIKTMAGMDIAFADPSTAADGGRPQTNKWYVSANAPGTSAPAAAPVYRLSFPLVEKQRRR